MVVKENPDRKKKIDTIPVLGENIDAWKTPGMGMKDFSNFVNDNWSFRKNVKTKKKDNEIDQLRRIQDHTLMR